MILNPFRIVILLYFASNTLALINGINNNGIIVEGQFFNLPIETMILSYICISLFLVFFYITNTFIIKNKRPDKISINNNWGILLILIQLSFFLFNKYYNLNIAGSSYRLSEQTTANLIFIILQPDNLFLIISSLIPSNLIFFINTIIFALSMSSRGWLGGLFLIGFIMLIRYYPVRLSFRRLLISIILLLLLLLFIPNLIELKWLIRNHGNITQYFSNISLYKNIQEINTSLQYIFNRFQHLGHVSIFMNNSDLFYENYINNQFLTYWWEGLPQKIVLKLLSYDSVTLSKYAVSVIYNIDNPSWNINTGIVSWIFVTREYSILIAVYLVFFYIIPLYYLAKHNEYHLYMLLSCFSIIFLFHGWFGAYFNIMIYTIIFQYIKRIRFRFKHKSHISKTTTQ
ncbi:oligosaccharide repeat unit polymerase [Morganella morganii]|uniref:oligosaccharide repeat unit polymerase n=1 Tax=Morganella TaxID=581 RepID=UPI003709E957